MNFKNQTEATQILQSYADKQRHAVLISGPDGCGKSYLAKYYSQLLNISDFYLVVSKMDSVRETLDACSVLQNNVVLCIENLDMAVNAVSYAILKFLEEPRSNVYIVVTCRNIKQIPDTIVSRCVTVNVPPMVSSDLTEYAKMKYPTELKLAMNDDILWKCVRSISDMKLLADLTPENIAYIHELCGSINPSTSVSGIVWKLQNFPDKKPTPMVIIIRYLMYSNAKWQKYCIECLNTLSFGRLGVHAAVSKLVFELKYSG